MAYSIKTVCPLHLKYVSILACKTWKLQFLPISIAYIACETETSEFISRKATLIAQVWILWLYNLENNAAVLRRGSVMSTLDHRSHITPALRELHWLQVKCIQFKVAVFMQVTAQRCPSYVADLVAFHTSDPQRHSGDLFARHWPVQPSSDERRTDFRRRAFSVCGPDVWNSLPSSLRTMTSHFLR